MFFNVVYCWVTDKKCMQCGAVSKWASPPLQTADDIDDLTILYKRADHFLSNQQCISSSITHLKQIILTKKAIIDHYKLIVFTITYFNNKYCIITFCLIKNNNFITFQAYKYAVAFSTLQIIQTTPTQTLVVARNVIVIDAQYLPTTMHCILWGN